MLLKFKGKDTFGNLAFTASEGKFPMSYHDLVKKNQSISKMSLNTFNPIYISPRYTFACITFKKNYNDLSIKSFEKLVVGSIFEIKFNLTKTDFKEKTFVNAVIIDLTLIEEPKEEEVLDF